MHTHTQRKRGRESIPYKFPIIIRLVLRAVCDVLYNALACLQSFDAICKTTSDLSICLELLSHIRLWCVYVWRMIQSHWYTCIYNIFQCCHNSTFFLFLIIHFHLHFAIALLPSHLASCPTTRSRADVRVAWTQQHFRVARHGKERKNMEKYLPHTQHFTTNLFILPAYPISRAHWRCYWKAPNASRTSYRITVIFDNVIVGCRLSVWCFMAIVCFHVM